MSSHTRLAPARRKKPHHNPPPDTVTQHHVTGHPQFPIRPFVPPTDGRSSLVPRGLRGHLTWARSGIPPAPTRPHAVPDTDEWASARAWDPRVGRERGTHPGPGPATSGSISRKARGCARPAGSRPESIASMRSFPLPAGPTVTGRN